MFFVRSKCRLNWFAVFALSTLSIAKGMAAEPEQGISGIYTGSMHLVDGFERDIPLAVSLLLTDETVAVPGGLENVIDGTFVVDEEGGPYTFTRVSYDLDNNRLDMKYSRPRNDPTTVAPAAFRLVGNFAADGSISGRVSSGLYGPIGTFKVTPDRSLKYLPHRNKYIGRWEGTGNNLKFKYKVPATLVLQASSRQNINPPNYEFEYTPGRICGYSMIDTWLASFDQVVIDYLRRRVFMVDKDGAISLDLTIDFLNKTMTGSQSSGAWGLTVLFDKLRQME